MGTLQNCGLEEISTELCKSFFPKQMWPAFVIQKKQRWHNFRA